ncbi:hypothetical protein HUJ04_011194 [Dendroctonus ponderosae]|nr:hypothetical protein HUJ04_011194 [Dendroctonus ponderosae]
MDKYKFSPSRIFNCDETGITTGQRPSKIYGKKELLGEGKNYDCHVSEIYVPPIFIYVRKRMADHLKNNGPPGAIYRCSDNGWITKNLFCEWLQHFQHCVKSSNEDPVLLLLDNHSGHCSLNAYNFCKERGMILLTIPPCSTD